MKILISEDTPFSAKLLQHLLASLGHEVTCCSNGVEAWEEFDRCPVRIIVSDWMMPGLDGLELCRKVRERPNTPYTYFILLTAREAELESYDLAMNAGIDDFLPKPLDANTMRMRLHVAERILRFTTEIRRLKNIIPMCSWCRKIRNDHDFWQLVETYLVEQTGTAVSHGVCPTCREREFPKTHVK